MRVPRGDLPTIRRASERNRPTKNNRLTCGRGGRGRRGPLVSYHRSIGAQRDNFNLSIIRGVSRRELRRFDPLLVGFEPAPFAV